MKHNIKITIVLWAMFVVTQFIGIYVINHYSSIKVVNGEIINVSSPDLPFGLETPKEADIKCKLNSVSDFFKCTEYLYSIIISFMIAIFLLFFLSKFNMASVLRLWFFIVVMIALALSFNAFIPQKFIYSSIIALAVALPLAFIKIYKKGFFVHNFTELFIYPGIAAVFVPILNIYTIITLLILISAYDMWAVWHSGIMQKMAKYQIDKLNIFSGFFVPYLSKNLRKKIKEAKAFNSKKTKKQDLTKLKDKKVKVNIAILGGGDVIFPIITAGVMLRTLGLGSALLVIAGATFGLTYLFVFAEKKKFYPAMPFITAGIFAGIILSYLLF